MGLVSPRERCLTMIDVTQPDSQRDNSFVWLEPVTGLGTAIAPPAYLHRCIH
jgi:hypothetical protein